MTDLEHFAPWLYRIAYNTILDTKRTCRPKTSIDEAKIISDTSLAADASYQYQELYAALAQLPPKERTTVLLYYINGYAIHEISEITECSESAVKKQLERGRNELRQILRR